MVSHSTLGLESPAWAEGTGHHGTLQSQPGIEVEPRSQWRFVEAQNHVRIMHRSLEGSVNQGIDGHASGGRFAPWAWALAASGH